MKIKSVFIDKEHYIRSKLIRIMKLTSFLILVTLMQVTASVYSQNTLLNLSMKNTALKEVFREIEKQSEFTFLYNNAKIDVNKEVNVDVHSAKIEDILGQVLNGTGISYVVIDKQVVLAGKDQLKSAVEAAQQKGTKVTGKVTDQTGTPLPGAAIIIKGTTTGVITDYNGVYALPNIPSGATIVFSFLGMGTKEIVFKGQSTENVVLEENAVGVEEVVVIGYGTAKKKNLIGAVDQIGANILEDRAVSNTTQALQGASANLVIQQKSMNPNDNNTNINIRGVSTMNNNDPLIVIDGLITEMESLNKLNPADIENVSVLKDAGSAAIYGSRSSNGVILVTTKKGSKNSKPVVRFNTMVGMQDTKVLFSPVKGYENAMLRNQALINGGSSPIYTPAQIRDFQKNGDGQWFLDGILQNAPQQNYNASISGGNETSTYMVSAGYYNQAS
ncbi:MAG TPA: carboxypeptidase-like regulatory domain-containing protein, partial [Prolixibacteraceae bacterium]